MAKTAKELLAEYASGVTLGDALRAMQDLDAKLDQVMATHAANFEARAKGIEENVKTYLRYISGVLANILTRLDALENPGKTDNNMRQP